MISYSGGDSPNAGIDVFISANLQSNIQSAVQANCQSLDQSCFQAVQDQIISPNTNLQARFIPLALAIVSLAILAQVEMFVVTVVTAMLFTGSEKLSPSHIYIPTDQVSQVSNAADAIVTIVSIDTSTAFTITPVSFPTTITG